MKDSSKQCPLMCVVWQRILLLFNIRYSGMLLHHSMLLFNVISLFFNVCVTPISVIVFVWLTFASLLTFFARSMPTKCFLMVRFMSYICSQVSLFTFNRKTFLPEWIMTAILIHGSIFDNVLIIFAKATRSWNSPVYLEFSVNLSITSYNAIVAFAFWRKIVRMYWPMS